MAVEDRTRHARLRALLPRAYATDPRDSVLGVLLDALADRLRELDRATERALRDKWLATAEAQRDPIDSSIPDPTAGPDVLPEPLEVLDLGGEPRPLEHLGAALDLLRQPWELDEQAYRARVAGLAPLMTRGLATPRALLSFAVGALGAEPCPHLERNDDDATTAIGLAPGRVARCRACRGGRRTPAGPCPLRAESTMTASVVDNPRGAVRLRRDSLRSDVAVPTLIHFDSDSLFFDRPELELRVQAGDAPRFDENAFDTTSFPELRGQIVPSFRNRETNERLVVLYPLTPGDTLSILPRSPHQPPLPPPHLRRWVDRPAIANPLSPVLRINGDDVDAPVILFSGVSFDEARFGVDRFASDGGAPRFDVGHFEEASFDQPAVPSTIEVTTLAIVPGPNTWEYAPLDTESVTVALAAVPTGAPPAPVVDTTNLPPVSLRLRWWTRPVARFLLSIPSSPAVRRAVALGAAGYVRRVVERVRPVGVTPIIDFLQPHFRDSPHLDPSDRIREVALALVEPLTPADSVVSGVDLPNEVLEGLDSMAFGGIFDVTPFDFSDFGMPLVELSEALEPAARGGFGGLFDVTPFDFSGFGMPLVELSEALEPAARGGFVGIFDATPFEFGLLAE